MPRASLPPALQHWQKELDDYLATLFSESRPSIYTEGKIVRDAVFGYQWLEPHEWTIIDSPVLQRLRYIHQTAVAYELYPSANHTRFEHSIGVASLAGKMAETLRLSQPDFVTSRDVLEVRLAGLLHDSGHALFSHLSESIMTERFGPSIQAIHESGYFKKKIGLGEMLSFLIVTSETFRNYWEEVRGRYSAIRDITVESIADLIVGQVASTGKEYKANIISGPFDADKLDYFARDSHFTGIRVEIDVERILRMIKILHIDEAPQILVMRRGGVPHLEQILFGKMMLYYSVYHHHKVRAAECLFRSIFELIDDEKIEFQNAPTDAWKFASPVDFLRVSEAEFFVVGLQNDRTNSRIRSLRDRNLFKRALVLNSISMPSAQQGQNFVLFEKLVAMKDWEKGYAFPNSEPPDALGFTRYEALLDLRRKIFEDLPSVWREQTEIHDLWLDAPRDPLLGNEAELCYIEAEPGQPPVTLSQFFPAKGWTDAYRNNKWVGHVFYIADQDARRAARESAKRVFLDVYGSVVNDTLGPYLFK